MPSASDFVALRPGPTGASLCVPVAALRVLWDMEARGFVLRQDGDAIVVRPAEKLTDVDRALLKRWKPHLLALLNYSGPGVAS